MDVALCAIGKNENLYIREWVEYHKSIGFSKIYLYDNNSNSGEHFEDVISDYINSKFVKLINYRGKKTAQIESYGDCYGKYRSSHDWIAFLDCDEFLVVPNDDINEYVSSRGFSSYSQILINWMMMDDNGHAEYSDAPVLERFTHPCGINESTSDGFYTNKFVKSIVNCSHKVSKFKIHIHITDDRTYCDSNGKRIDPSSIDTFSTKIPYVVQDKAYIKHFFTKSTEEWCERRIMGTRAAGLGQLDKKRRMDQYFSINERTDEKINVFKRYI